MRINQHYPPDNKLQFVVENLFPFIYRVALIQFTRVSVKRQQKAAHKQLMELRKVKQEATESEKTMSKPEIRSLNKKEQELMCIRDDNITIKNIEDDDLTDIAMSFEKFLNVIIVCLTFVIVKPIMFMMECLWNCLRLLYSAINEEALKELKKRKMKKELLSKMTLVDDDLDITTV